MSFANTSPLHSSWPLWEQPRHFDLALILNCAVADAIEPEGVGALGLQHAGLWECDLTNETLTWSGGVYDIFGLPRGTVVSRSDALSLYSEDSRAKLERLRSHAIRHKRGFTLDIDIRAAAVGEARRVRLIGAPVCQGGKVICLHGLKFMI
jgi:PAS domain-containing protein